MDSSSGSEDVFSEVEEVVDVDVLSSGTVMPISSPTVDSSPIAKVIQELKASESNLLQYISRKQGAMQFLERLKNNGISRLEQINLSDLKNLLSEINRAQNDSKIMAKKLFEDIKMMNRVLTDVTLSNQEFLDLQERISGVESTTVPDLEALLIDLNFSLVHSPDISRSHRKRFRDKERDRERDREKDRDKKKKKKKRRSEIVDGIVVESSQNSKQSQNAHADDFWKSFSDFFRLPSHDAIHLLSNQVLLFL